MCFVSGPSKACSSHIFDHDESLPRAGLLQASSGRSTSQVSFTCGAAIAEQVNSQHYTTQSYAQSPPTASVIDAVPEVKRTVLAYSQEQYIVADCLYVYRYEAARTTT
jgi:hypothetical protein